MPITVKLVIYAPLNSHYMITKLARRRVAEIKTFTSLDSGFSEYISSQQVNTSMVVKPCMFLSPAVKSVVKRNTNPLPPFQGHGRLS